MPQRQAAAVLALSCCQYPSSGDQPCRTELHRPPSSTSVMCSASLHLLIMTVQDCSDHAEDDTLCCLAHMCPAAAGHQHCCQLCDLHRPNNHAAEMASHVLRQVLHGTGAARSRGDGIPARASSLCHSLAPGAHSAPALDVGQPSYSAEPGCLVQPAACALQSSGSTSPLMFCFCHWLLSLLSLKQAADVC